MVHSSDQKTNLPSHTLSPFSKHNFTTVTTNIYKCFSFNQTMSGIQKEHESKYSQEMKPKADRQAIGSQRH